MPNLSRRQVRTQSGHATPTTVTTEMDIDEAAHQVGAGIDVDLETDSDLGDGAEKVEEEVELDDSLFPVRGLKEISSLASWTVSTAKPGNGVAALRSPDLAQFWQSDGPQPHLLSIHFFKLVSIVHMRIYLDFKNDDSYTPTKIQFLAGMGVHDIQEFAEMTFEQPTGWIDVDFSHVGPVLEDDDDDVRNALDDDDVREVDWSKRPTLRAFLLHVRILENHQNGKDTHLRAVQIFARDETQEDRRGLQPAQRPIRTKVATSIARHAVQQTEANNIKLASWMMEPDLR